jgi:hypothetical protein
LGVLAVNNTGFRNPHRTILIWLAATLVSWASVAWGVSEMQRLGYETVAVGIAIGVALAPAIIAPGMLLLAVNGARIVAAIRRGDKVIARWTVSPTDLAEFAVNNAARNARGDGYRNDWTPPRRVPPAGIDITFSPDGVLVGDSYFGLVTTGMFKFEGVRILPENPLAIEFGTVATAVSKAITVHLRTSRAVLRLPVSRLASTEAARVLAYFIRVDKREIIVNAGFYRARLRFALIAAPICFVAAAIGFALEFGGYGREYGLLTLLLAVGGVVSGIGALILALAAWWMSQVQRAPRQ